MPEFGSSEAYTPGEDGGGVSEQASEAAREQYRASQAQGKQQAKDEKKARHRDDRVAQAIRKFLGNKSYEHFFQLISRLAARDCPSVFILALLSLMHEDSRLAVEEYIAEKNIVLNLPAMPSSIADSDGLAASARSDILHWISRLSLVMATDTEHILSRLMVDEDNIDGTVLQLATFVLVEFFIQQKRAVPFEELQPLTIKILQDVIEPHMAVMEAYFARINASEQQETLPD